MTELAAITLDNEMDLILAYKKSIRVAERLGLALSTQTAFATAVSEVCREVIDKAFEGHTAIGIKTDNGRFMLAALISCRPEEMFNRDNEGLDYARKLVPSLELRFTGTRLEIALQVSIPSTAKVDHKKINLVKGQLQAEGPVSAYEEVKLQNARLYQQNMQQEHALLHAEYINQQKTEFLSLASHELNSPLTVLRSFAQIALRVEDGRDPALHQYLLKIEQQSGKLVTLIQQLLDISKIENGQLNYSKEATGFNRFISDTMDGIRLLVPNHEVRVSVARDCRLEIDQLRMEQVLSNLVTNAAKYSEPGSLILIETDCHAGIARVSVTDKGIGMDSDTLRQIFNKFYRGEQVVRKYSGMGMGLYVASRIVADHRGQMQAESQPGEGSVFSFSIPALAETL